MKMPTPPRNRQTRTQHASERTTKKSPTHATSSPATTHLKTPVCHHQAQQRERLLQSPATRGAFTVPPASSIVLTTSPEEVSFLLFGTTAPVEEVTSAPAPVPADDLPDAPAAAPTECVDKGPDVPAVVPVPADDVPDAPAAAAVCVDKGPDVPVFVPVYDDKAPAVPAAAAVAFGETQAEFDRRGDPHGARMSDPDDKHQDSEATGFEDLAAGVGFTDVVLPADVHKKHEEIKAQHAEELKAKKIKKEHIQSAETEVKDIDKQIKELGKINVEKTGRRTNATPN